MNLETNKAMKEIITNLQNWQVHKEDLSLMNDLLSKADFFKIDYEILDDNSESYHLYPALEIFEDSEQNQSFQLVFYMISKNSDTKDFISDNKDNIETYIKKFNVIDKLLFQDTEITEEEATIRKNRWSKDIKDWIFENEMFEVFDIPSEDFNLTDEVKLQGHFGMKEVQHEDNLSQTNFLPDIMIYHLNPDDSLISFFDMARLSPPYGRQRSEFALLDLLS